MKKAVLTILSLITLLPTMFLSSCSCSNSSNEKLYVIYNEMHKQYGDGILIKYKNYEILVDGGDSSDTNALSQTLKEYCQDHVLDLLIATHPHADHIGAYSSTAFSKGEIESITNWIDSGATYTSSVYDRYCSLRDNYIEYGTNYLPAYNIINQEEISKRIYLDKEDNVYIDIFNNPEYPLPNTKYQGGEINNVSVVFGLNYNKTQFYFGGDLETLGEKGMLAIEDKDYFKKDNFVVYKASHHGSTGANSYDILNWVKPDMFFVSAAITNANRTSAGIKESQHPHSGTITRFKTFSNRIYWNGINGRTILTSNGVECSMKGEGRTIDYYFNGTIVPPLEEKDKTYVSSKWYNGR